MKKGSLLVLGGRSDMGLAVAYRFASLGFSIQLATRKGNSDKDKILTAHKSDIELRYNVPVSLFDFDALDVGSYQKFLDGLPTLADITVCAIGLLGEQQRDEQSLTSSIEVMRSNYEGPALIFTLLANMYEKRGHGTLVGISSVAGERGRASNYIYGSAKSGYSSFLSGLRNRLAKKGVHVITVLPGFVASKMTEGLDLPARLTSQPNDVAIAIERAVCRKRNIVYVKPIWQIIMLVIRNIPEGIFKKMKI